MIGLELFFYVALPLLVLALGALATFEPFGTRLVVPNVNADLQPPVSEDAPAAPIFGRKSAESPLDVEENLLENEELQAALDKLRGSLRDTSSLDTSSLLRMNMGIATHIEHPSVVRGSKVVLVMPRGRIGRGRRQVTLQIPEDFLSGEDEFNR
ncbi:hypothetical protein AB9E28_24725 [Rhizobium leguminosarum]|uniref:hypothetical protein n=1 Tax=Rhizobium leguminosarum TaxID=384 RepID=UPI003F99AAFA